MIRCTARLLTIVGQADPAAAKIRPADPDWHASIMWIEGRKCLHSTHAATLFTVFAPEIYATDLRPPGPLITAVATTRLEAAGLLVDVLVDLDGAHALIGKTANRQILGYLNDQACAIRWMVEHDGGLAHVDIEGTHHRLQNNIVSARKYRSPLDLIADRLSGA